MEQAIFGGGCFWCIEAQFQRVRGVKSVVSGYTGGYKENPTYEEVKKEQTGHLEVVKLTFDPNIVSYQILLDIFFVIHDPTQSDGQGEDIGTQYLSAIFYENEHQKVLAEKKLKELESEGKKIATLIKGASKFYAAEEFHQNYFNLKGSGNPYCNIIPGKIAKMKKYFKEYCEE